MFCPFCGFNNYGCFKFCPRCGAQMPHFEEKQIEPADRKIKKILSSKTFLLLTVFLSLSMFFGILSVCFETKDQYADIISQIPYYTQQQMGFDLDLIQTVSLMCSILFNIPTMLMIFGLWYTYSCAKSNEEPMSTAGLTLVKGVLSFTYIFMYILEALLIIGMIILAAVLFSVSSVGGFVFFIVAFMLLAFYLPFIIFYAKLISTLKAVRETLQTGIANGNISIYAAVMCFVTGGIGFFSVISSILMGVFTFLAGAASFGAAMTGGILLLNCRSIMRQHLKEEAENLAFGNYSYFNQNNNYYR